MRFGIRAGYNTTAMNIQNLRYFAIVAKLENVSKTAELMHTTQSAVSKNISTLEEELGITASPEQLTFAGTFRIRYEKIFRGKPFRDNEVTRVYVYREPVDIDCLTLQESEVDEVRWFDPKEVRTEIHTSRERFCVPSEGLNVLMRFLQNESRGQVP